MYEKKQIKETIEVCDEKVVYAMEKNYRDCPTDDNWGIFLLHKYAGYIRSWIKGKNVPDSVLQKALAFFQEEPGGWGTVCEGIMKNNPKFLEEA